MPMPSCPRCHQPVSSQDVRCPTCQMVLKAHGHPGIPVHRATENQYLCETCTYEADDTCNYPQRPYAQECTMYQNQSEALIQQVQTAHASRRAYLAQFRGRQNVIWIAIAGLIAISFLIAFIQNR